MGYVGIRNETGRYIRYNEDQEEFCNASKDPHEWTNEIDNPEYAETIRKLRAAVPDLSEMAPPLPPSRRSQ